MKISKKCNDFWYCVHGSFDYHLFTISNLKNAIEKEIKKLGEKIYFELLDSKSSEWISHLSKNTLRINFLKSITIHFKKEVLWKFDITETKTSRFRLTKIKEKHFQNQSF